MQQKMVCFFIVLLAALNGSMAQQLKVDSLLSELAKSKEDTNKVILYRMLTGLVKNADPTKAIAYGKAGVALGTKLNFDKGIAGCYLNLSAAYSDASQIDSGITAIDSAIYWSHRAGDPNRLALAYLNRADFQMQLRNLRQALVDCDTAFFYAEKANNDDRRARILQTIGSVYYLQDKYPESKEYYNKAIVFYQQVNNGKMMAIVLHNLGNIYKHTGETETAINHFKRAIALGDSLQDLVNMSMYYGSLADVYVDNGFFELAALSAGKSLQFASDQNNLLRKAIAYTVFAQLYLKQKKYALAIDAAGKSLQIAKEEDDIEVQYNAAGILADAYAAKSDYQHAFHYLETSKQLNDSLLKLRYDEDIAAMQTSFRVGEKNKEILLLNSDKELQHQQLLKQRFLLISVAAFSILLLAAITLLVNRYRLRQRIKEMAIRNQIAADLHDEVGSSLSSIHMLSRMAAAKQSADSSQNEILTRMSMHTKETMDKMGDIVWMIKPGETEAGSLKQRMEHFAYSICSSQNIEVAISIGDLETIKLSMEKRKNIYLIFKEALNNAVKYSGAGKITIEVGIRQKQLHLRIADDGKGFNVADARHGNGLDNMNNRASEMGGTLEIQSNEGTGTVVELTAPI